MYIRNINNIDYIKVNDTATQIQLKIFDNLNNPFDLKSAMQVFVVIGNHNGRILTKIPDILDDTGVLEFGLDNGDLLEVGHNLLEVHIIMPNGEKFVAPSKGYYKLSASRSIDSLGEEVTTVTLDYFLEEANRALDQVNTKVEYVNQTADNLRREVATAIQYVDDTAEDLRQEVGENLNQTTNDLRQEVSTAIQYVDDTVDDLRQEVSENLNQTTNDLRQEVSTAIQYVDDAVDDLRQEVSENLDSLVTQEIDNKMTPFVEVVNERLDKKANYSDVAKISSGTPLFATDIAGMTDTTRAYVNTTDGFIYLYDSEIEEFTNSGVLYQATVSNDFPATNMIKNGNFSDGVNNWTKPSKLNIESVDNALEITVVEPATYNYNYVNSNALNADTSHKYFLKFEYNVKHEEEIRVYVNGGYITPPFLPIALNKYVPYSVIFSPENMTGSFGFRHSTTNYQVGEKFYIRNVLMVDLTLTFGEGNEPTVEEMNKLLERFPMGWFDGTISPLVSVKELYLSKPKDGGTFTDESGTVYKYWLSAESGHLIFNYEEAL